MAGLLAFIEDLKEASHRMRKYADSASDCDTKRRHLAVADSLDKMVERAEADAAKLGLRARMELSLS